MGATTGTAVHVHLEQLFSKNSCLAVTFLIIYNLSSCPVWVILESAQWDLFKKPLFVGL